MRRRKWFSIGLLLASLSCGAQSPAYTVSMRLDTVQTTGFYRIILPPELVARCKSDLTDLRISRSDGVFVPYVLNLNTTEERNTGYLPLPDPTIRQKDSSNKHSYISLQYSDSYRIERLSLVIQNPILYKRVLRVINPDDDRAGALPVMTNDIDPKDTAFRIPAVQTRRLLIDISNEDNAPLVVSRVASGQSDIYILTHLEKGRGYELQAGDVLAQAPAYDLHYFTDSLKQQPLNIGLGPLNRHTKRISDGKAAPGASVKAQEQTSGNTRSTILLWSVLVLVLLLLLYISFKMVKAIAKKETNDRL